MSPRHRKGVEKPSRVFAWLTALFFLAIWYVFLRAQNPGLMSDDSGEMIAASYNLGIAHPPGYPLLCLIGHLFSLLPLGQPSFRFNLMSSFFTLFAAAFLLAACQSLVRSEKGLDAKTHFGMEWLATAAILLFLLSCSSIFAQSLTAKGDVYTLTLLFLTVFLWLRLKYLQRLGKTFIPFFIFFLWGLGLANHWQTVLLWFPFLLLWLYQEKYFWTVKKAVFFSLFVGIGLSLYLYLPLRAALHAQPSWGNPASLNGFLWSLKRVPFAGLEPVFRNVNFYTGFFREYIHILWAYWAPGSIVLVFAGIYGLWKKQRSLFYLLAFFYVPIVLGILTVPRQETLFLINVYLVPVHAIWAFAGFYGLLQVCQWINHKSGKFMIAFLGVVLAGMVLWFAHVAQMENKSRYFLAGDFGLNALKNLPRDSIFLAEGDHYVMPIFYERFVEGKRKDLIFSPSIFLFHAWGWDQLAGQDEKVRKAILSTALFDGRLQALAGLRPVRPLYYSLDREYLERKLEEMPGAWVPMGLEYEWFHKKPLTNIVFQETLESVKRERFRGMEVFASHPDVSTREIYRYYANQHCLTAHWLYLQGAEEAALYHFEKGLSFYPKIASAYNDMAVILGKWGYLEMAKQLCELGIQIDPNYSPCYLNLANACWFLGDPESAIHWYQKAMIISSQPQEIQSRIEEIRASSTKKAFPLIRKKTVDDYEKLGKYFRQIGLPRLGLLASTSFISEDRLRK